MINKLSKARNPDKIWNIMEQLQHKDSFFPAPISIEIQPTSACNLRCRWCSYWDRNGFGKERPKSLTLDILQPMIEYVSRNGCKSIYLAGGGEPCAYRDIKKLVNVISERGLSIAMITNGTLFAKKLINQADKFSYLQVSLISSDQENYENSTRSRFGFTEMSQLPNIIKNRHARKSPMVGGMYVITEWNYKGAIDAINFCRDNNYDYCSFRAAIDFEKRGVALNKDIIDKLQNQLKEEGNTGGYTNLSTVLDNALKDSYDSKKCLNISHGLYCIIDPHGGVFLCIPDVSKKQYCIGNLHNCDFSEIWGGKLHREIIDKLRKRYLCNQCHHACRAHAYNKAYATTKPSTLSTFHDEFI